LFLSKIFIRFSVALSKSADTTAPLKESNADFLSLFSYSIFAISHGIGNIISDRSSVNSAILFSFIISFGVVQIVLYSKINFQSGEG
jgi:nitrate/nitrite transporter NarK